MGEIIGLVAVVLIFGTVLVAVWGEHQRKMIEARARAGNQDSAMLSELQRLRHEVEQLRDTTTKYDMSFDTALQRIESRVSNVEQRLSAVESETQVVQGRPA